MAWMHIFFNSNKETHTFKEEFHRNGVIELREGEIEYAFLEHPAVFHPDMKDKGIVINTLDGGCLGGFITEVDGTVMTVVLE